ncbi:MAG: ABC transporter permease [Paracoccus sp. (in: a-proteobacteria)]|nr:ABC transporter permease [Paracoccus sp. (in: a-proteobacteria)]
MVNLALQSVLHAWRRYLPVAIAVGVSGLLIAAQLAIALGAARSGAAPIEQSGAILWAGPADATSLETSAGLSPFAASQLWLDADVRRIEPWPEAQSLTLESDDPESSAYERQVTVLGLDVSEGALSFSRIIPPDLRRLLREPGTVLIGRADAARLGLAAGDRLRISGQPLRIIAVLPELRGLFSVQLLTSEATLRGLSSSGAAGGGAGAPSFYLMALRAGASPATVAERLGNAGLGTEMRVWHAQELTAATIRSWLFDSGIGMIFGVSAAMALGITLMVVNQTLGAAVAASIREYAALRAYGIAFPSLQKIVVLQGLHVGLAALALTGLASWLLIGALGRLNLPLSLPLPVAAAVGAVLMAVIMLSNLIAVRRLRKADPAGLLR